MATDRMTKKRMKTVIWEGKRYVIKKPRRAVRWAIYFHGRLLSVWLNGKPRMDKDTHPQYQVVRVSISELPPKPPKTHAKSRWERYAELPPKRKGKR